MRFSVRNSSPQGKKEGRNLNSMQNVQRERMGNMVFGSIQLADHVISLQYRRVTCTRRNAP